MAEVDAGSFRENQDQMLGRLSATLKHAERNI